MNNQLRVYLCVREQARSAADVAQVLNLGITDTCNILRRLHLDESLERAKPNGTGHYIYSVPDRLRLTSDRLDYR